MQSLLGLIVLSLLATCIQAAYAPLHWMNRIITPKDFAGRFDGIVPPLSLVSKAPSDDTFPSVIPSFSARPDFTITWDDMGWCVEAKPDDVQLNRCHGGPSQKWNVMPDRHGKEMIQLRNSNACLDVSSTGLVELRECDQAIGAWRFEESFHAQPETSYVLRYAIVSLIGLAGLGALSLWWRTKARAVAFHSAFGDAEMGTGSSCPPATHTRLGDVSMTAANDPSVTEGEAAFTRRVALAGAAAGLVAASNVVPAFAVSARLVSSQEEYTRYAPPVERTRDFWSGPLLKAIKNNDWAFINKELEPEGRQGKSGRFNTQFNPLRRWSRLFKLDTYLDMFKCIDELLEASVDIERAAIGLEGGVFGVGMNEMGDAERQNIALEAQKTGALAFNKFIEIGNGDLGPNLAQINKIDLD